MSDSNRTTSALGQQAVEKLIRYATDRLPWLSPLVRTPEPVVAETNDAGALSHTHFPWLRALHETQQEIAELATLPYYGGVLSGTDALGKQVSFPPYRDAEIYFWTNIPRWIWEDSRRRPVKRSLDVGCSYGTLSLFTHKVTAAEIYLMDFIPNYMSNRLLARYPFRFLVSNAELDDLPFEGQFDQIILTEVIEHLNFHPVPTLRKLRDRLTDEGRLYLSTPDSAFHGRVTDFFADYQDMPHPQRTNKPPVDAHIYQYSKSELLEVVREAGLTVERVDYAPGYLAAGQIHLNLACTKAPKSGGSD